jgi:hypothetical protein
MFYIGHITLIQKHVFYAPNIVTTKTDVTKFICLK